MAFLCWMLLLLLKCSSLSDGSSLVDTEKEALLQLPDILEYPSLLADWNAQTDFCGLQLAMEFAVSCEGGHVTHLQIIGRRESSKGSNEDGMLSSSFSLESLLVHLSIFSRLKNLRLNSLGLWGPLPSKLGQFPYMETFNMSSNFLWGALPNSLMSMQNLQVLALDHNMLNGSLPQNWSSLPKLSILNLASNMIQGQMNSDFFSQLPLLQKLNLNGNLLSGRVPISLSNATNMQALSLSGNDFHGNLPDLSTLPNLMTINLQENQIGPAFPSLSPKLHDAILRNNNLQGPVPGSIARLQQMQLLDLSCNLLSGVLPPALFTLPSIQYLSVARNRLSGSLPLNLTLASSIKMIDLSFNLFTGQFPMQLAALVTRSAIKAQWNCLSTSLQPQNPFSYCQNAAMASGIYPQITGLHKDGGVGVRIGILVAITGSILAIAIATLALLFALLYRKRSLNVPSPRSNGGGMCMGSKSICVSTELLASARYISKTLKLGALGLPQFRMFSMDELYKATDYFHESSLIGEGSQGKVYKGHLDDGLLVVIKCLRKERVRSAKNVATRIERLAKFRHPNLVAILGYNLAAEHAGMNQEDVQVYIIYEYLSNRTLQTRLAGKSQDEFGWPQRLLAIIGAAKGVHYLHTGMFPGIFDNNIRIENILLDQNLVSKVSDFGLASPLDTAEDGDARSPLIESLSSVEGFRKKLLDKKDVFNFGLVLLEVLVGKPLASGGDGNNGKRGKLMEIFLADQGSRDELIDPRIHGACNMDMESLETVVEITAKCLSEDVLARPSMEDVLWNLKYALQVQESSNGGSQEDIVEVLYPLELQGIKSGKNVTRVGKMCNEDYGKPSSPNAEFLR